MKRIITAAVAVILFAAILTSGASAAGYFDPQLRRQEAAHAVAETARAYGYAEDSAVIQAASADWWAAQDEINRDMELLTRVVWCEAGSDRLPDRQQQLVACVVLNRCADPRFPSTIQEVVYAPKQYSCTSWLYRDPWSSIPARCYENARAAAFGEVDCPACVVWQSGGFQGVGLYCKIGNTYFCY
ncbi:MAG: cell wall hydrolase [Oscillospiraceae bacterium]|nr:cell wall hydrolase [Oscillospiraceae bacterium]